MTSSTNEPRYPDYAAGGEQGSPGYAAVPGIYPEPSGAYTEASTFGQTSGGYPETSDTDPSSPPTGDDGAGVKEKASDVAQSATQSGKDVASEAAGHVKEVAGEAKRQARDLLGEARNQVSDQASTQQQSATRALRGLSDQLRSMADNSEQSGLATEFAHQASDRTGSIADWLDGRQPGDLLNDVRDFARRRPGAFLLGALVAGVVAGRLTRNLASSGGSDTDRASDTSTSLASAPLSSTRYESSTAGTITTGEEDAYPAVSDGIDPLGATTPPDPYLTDLAPSDDVQRPAADLEGRVRP